MIYRTSLIKLTNTHVVQNAGERPNNLFFLLLPFLALGDGLLLASFGLSQPLLLRLLLRLFLYVSEQFADHGGGRDAVFLQDGRRRDHVTDRFLEREQHLKRTRSRGTENGVGVGEEL